MSKESYLSHHGVKGQQWGVRRYQNKDGTRKSKYSEDYVNSRVTKKKGIKGMSNKELREVNTRLQLESTYKNLNNSGNNYVKSIMSTKKVKNAVASAALSAAAHVGKKIIIKHIT